MIRRFVAKAHNRQAFTLMEALVSMAILGIIGVSIFVYQSSSWRRTTKANRTIVAGHLIERQIEAMRMRVELDSTKFPPKGETGSFIENGVTVNWSVSAAYRPVDNAELGHVRKCDLFASWGDKKGDTMRVSTYLSRKF